MRENSYDFFRNVKILNYGHLLLQTKTVQNLIYGFLGLKL